MTGRWTETAWRRNALVAAVAVFCLSAVCSEGQPPRGEHATSHASAVRREPAPRPAGSPARGRGPSQAAGANVQRHPEGAVNAYGNRYVDTRPLYPGPPYVGPGVRRPTYPGYQAPISGPPGHLQSWLDAHRNVPVENQEQMLRRDPSFQRLPPGEQQRLLRQLRDVNQLTVQQRARRLARNEILEHLSPMERMQVNRSAREWTQLPPERQALMKSAFRDLRSVPPDQRGIVLNSERYASQFTPQERGILTEMLKVEPYEPPRP